MKILYVTGIFPKISESFVINEIHELEQRGHNVSVFSLRGEGEDITHKEIQDLDLNVYYGNRPSYTSLPNMVSEKIIRTRVLRRAIAPIDPRSLAYWLYQSKEISEAIENERGVDIIHAHFANPDRIAASYAAAYHDIPCTITAHAHEIFAPDKIRYLELVCSLFDHLVVPSRYNREYLLEEIGVENDITVVPATTSVEKFEPSEGCESGRLLTVARLVEKKGHKYAIDAVADLIEQGYDVEYHIIGTGERETLLRNQVQERRIEDHVEFLGHVSDEQLLTELHEAAVFVLPCVVTANGDRDITPVALREAMATQTACVSTTISAIPEVITDGYDGILVEPNDSTELTHAIAELLDEPLKRQEIAENGQQTVETKFDISTAVDSLLNVFRTVQQKY